MTDWTNHHPPHDHPDFDAYLDHLTAINDAIAQAANEPPDSTRHRQHADTEATPDNDLNQQ